MNGHQNVAELLLQFHANVNAQDKVCTAFVLLVRITLLGFLESLHSKVMFQLFALPIIKIKC